MRLRWAATVALGLGFALLASMLLQSRSVLQHFRASDHLVANLHRSVAQANLLLLCRRMQSSRLAMSAAEPPADENDIALQAKAAGLEPREIAGFVAAVHDTGPAGLEPLCADLARGLAGTEREYPRLDAARIAWQTDAYRLLLVTGNFVVFAVVLGAVLAVQYANRQALALRRINLARRAVLQVERRQAGFLAAAGHDLRQPLQALRLFLSIMLQRRMDPETRAIGGKVEAAAASMQRMIGSLVDVAKLDAGLISADWRDVTLGELLRSFTEEFRQLASEAGLRFTVGETSAVVYTDPDLLERILRNLLSNAVKYTTRGSIAVDVQIAQRRATIAVRDTGVGIHPDQMQTVFDDFFRVDQSGSDGLGLGLGIVKRLSDLLDAPVTVESTPGAGSVFSVTVPLSAEPVQDEDSEPAKQSSPEKRRLTALVVDDNHLVRDALAAQLQEWQIGVLSAVSRSEALAVASGGGCGPIDIIVTDYDLGDGTGLDLLAQIERATSQRPCALIVTGTSDQEVWKQLHRCSFRWLPKPIDSRQLQEEVGRLMDCARNRAQSRQLTQAS